MEKPFKQVYQFKLAQEGIVPPIWRRILVPEYYTFRELHEAILAVMGWSGYHLHEFEVQNPETGELENIGTSAEEFENMFTHEEGLENMLPPGGELEESYDTPIKPEKQIRIVDYFSPENRLAVYTYDFGDNLQVKVRFERALPRKAGVKYPVCTEGKRASIPEDIGGVWGYEDLLEILKDPKHPDYKDTLSWLGEDFDPDYFDPNDVIFPKPKNVSRRSVGVRTSK